MASVPLAAGAVRAHVDSSLLNRSCQTLESSSCSAVVQSPLTTDAASVASAGVALRCTVSTLPLPPSLTTSTLLVQEPDAIRFRVSGAGLKVANGVYTMSILPPNGSCAVFIRRVGSLTLAICRFVMNTRAHQVRLSVERASPSQYYILTHDLDIYTSLPFSMSIYLTSHPLKQNKAFQTFAAVVHFRPEFRFALCWPRPRPLPVY